MTSQLIVAAAVIEKDGLILVGQRRRGDTHPFKWEFPGGKVEHHESPRDALKRELREELGIDAEIGGELTRYEHQYPNRSKILLIFFKVTEYKGEEKAICFEQVAWAERSKLQRYDFLDGDIDFVARLARGEI